MRIAAATPSKLASAGPKVRRLVRAAPTTAPTLTAPAAARPALPQHARRGFGPEATARDAPGAPRERTPWVRAGVRRRRRAHPVPPTEHDLGRVGEVLFVHLCQS